MARRNATVSGPGLWLTAARLLLGLVCLGGAGGLGGCVTTQDKSRELARVAKDWCLSIRASQVMPVYPLTRDLLPGDVFLTTTPIGSEVALFESKGFLPLDAHLVRLSTVEQIGEFYKRRVGEGAGFPAATESWEEVPAAAFPSYSFDIRRGGGLNLAVPIQGVPVGLSYLGSAAATATISIQGGQTLGLDIATLEPMLTDWCREHQSLLAAYANGGEGDRAVYVRVVTRVFRAKRMAVHLDDVSSGGVSGAAGIALPSPDAGTPDAKKPAAERYSELAASLNATAQAQFGANVKVVSVSGRSVSLDETFPDPMVFGYQAFDCLILPGGVLSAPMPTYYRITGQPVIQPRKFNSAGLLMAWYTADVAGRAPRVKAWIEANLPEPRPGAVEFASLDAWDDARWRAMYDLGVLPR